jgi:hypothetical protein
MLIIFSQSRLTHLVFNLLVFSNITTYFLKLEINIKNSFQMKK